MTDDEIGALDRDNQKRIIALITGGLPIPPGTFEIMRLTMLVEALFSEDGLRAARESTAIKTEEQITALEKQVRSAKITAGASAPIVDLAQIHQINKQLVDGQS